MDPDRQVSRLRSQSGLLQQTRSQLIGAATGTPAGGSGDGKPDFGQDVTTGVPVANSGTTSANGNGTNSDSIGKKQGGSISGGKYFTA